MPTGLPFIPTAARDLDEVRDRVRRFFGDPFLAETEALPLGWYPPVEVIENLEAFVLTAELPGMNEKIVDITFEKGVLMIKGEKTDEHKEGDPKKEYHLWERTYGAFQRSFTFPSTVDEKKISAEFKKGVLTIVLPKTPEAKVKSMKIEIVAK
jgi:HSP20 family protein